MAKSVHIPKVFFDCVKDLLHKPFASTEVLNALMIKHGFEFVLSNYKVIQKRWHSYFRGKRQPANLVINKDDEGDRYLRVQIYDGIREDGLVPEEVLKKIEPPKQLIKEYRRLKDKELLEMTK